MMLNEEDHLHFVKETSKILKKMIGQKRMRFFGRLRWGAAEVSIVAIDGEFDGNNICVNVIAYSIAGGYYLYVTEDDEILDSAEVITTQREFDEWISDYDADDHPFKLFRDLTSLIQDIDRGVDEFVSKYISADWK